MDGVARLPTAKFTSSRLRRNMGLYLDHLLPAWLMDQVTRFSGGKPKFVRIQNKLWKAVEVLEYFTSREWHWTNDNMLFLKEQMNQDDQQEFDFDVRNIDWDVYLQNYFLGTKTFALKETDEKLPEAKLNIARLERRDTLINIALALTLWGIIAKRYTSINSYSLYSYTQLAFQQVVRLPALVGL